MTRKRDGVWHAERVAGDSRYGGTTVRQRESADSDEYLTSTRWTFDESDDDERDGWDLFGPARRFVRRYGWRAYALPVLVVITVAALMTTHAPQKKSPAAPARAPSPGARQPVNGIPPPASGTGVAQIRSGGR